MTISLPFTGSALAGTPWVVPGFESALDPVILYLSSAWPMWILFFIGIGLGWLFRSMRKKGAASEAAEPNDDAAATEPVIEAPAKDEGIERKLLAELEGELSAERRLGDQRRQELEALQNRLESVRRQRDEKQGRFETLSALLEGVSETGGSGRSLAQARAPVIHLDELVQLERQNLNTGLERLGDLEARLSSDSEALWNSAESAAALRDTIDAAYGERENPAAELMHQVGVADEHLRVFHQNVQGCLQRIAATKLRLQSEEQKLEEATVPIAESEAALANLAASETPPDPAGIEAAFDQALDRLSQSRAAVESLENGIDQEIAELTGRIDWVVEDSPRNYLTALDELDRLEPPSDPEVRDSFNQIWRHLTEARQILSGIDVPLDGSAFGESEYGTGKHRIVEAFESAVAMMVAAKAAPPSVEVEVPAETEGQITHLERQLALRESETARLDQKLKLTGQELLKLREENEQLCEGIQYSGLTAEPPVGGSFVRRLLGLGPERTPHEAQQTRETASAVTLAEAREILNELKLSSTNGSGNGGAPDDGESEADESPPSTEIEEASPSTEDEEKVEKPDPPELAFFREKVKRQKMRIAELEAFLSELREVRPAMAVATAPESDRIAVVRILPGEEVTTTESEAVVFRGDNPVRWDSAFEGPDEAFAMPLQSLPDDIHYLRLKRLDTGESVVISLSRSALIDGTGTSAAERGWTGRGECYFGSKHLGIYDESLPREVETKFGAGGWGFGHLETIGSGQAFGWAGRRIEPTRFEISVGTAPLPSAERETEPEPEPATGPAATGPTTEEETSGEAVVPATGLIIFRSNDPAIWGESTYSGANCRSRALNDLPEDIAWLRIRSLPGGESVILPVTKADLTRNGDGLIRGFNGSNELFYGARHLGAFDESLPLEVETRFTYGGWGFGHCPAGPEEQACGWAGREIDQDTVFEFTVYREMPYVDSFLDRVFEG